MGADVLRRPNCLSISGDGTRLAVSGQPERAGTYETLEHAGETRVFEVPTWRHLARIGHTKPFFVSFSGVDSLAIASEHEGGLGVWDVQGIRQRTFDAPGAYPVATFARGENVGCRARAPSHPDADGVGGGLRHAEMETAT
ncbi:MAG: hypothetical protein HY319_13545 [Armatimonadetes bacterium]|nr:hypothetical protein [Armatimonadota bacterium]